jgi:two-component system, OmpR family, phosphate regulon sensor histidine kinase PhoR
MGSSATRMFILTFGIVITIVVGLQMYWLHRTYTFEQQNFHTSIVKSIRGLYEDIDMAYDPGNRLSKLVETPNADTYIFRVDSIPSADSLLYYLIYEFDDFNVYTDCIAGIYDNTLNAYAYMGYLPSVGSPKNKSNNTQLPLYTRDHSYVCLYFPHRQSFVLRRMDQWIIITVIVLALLIGLSFTLYYFFRQKFLNEVQTDFINNVTHEFSTPLAVIELSTDGLDRYVTDHDSKLMRYTDMIRHQAAYLKKHIVALMNTATAEHHATIFEKSPVVVNSLIKRAVKELATLTNEKNGNMVLQLEQSNITVNAEPDHLYLAIFNIMNNALKYSASPRVVVTTYSKNNSYHIRIRDNGKGIGKKDISNIFRKFYRVQNANVHQSKGLGLGLYLSRRAVLRHKGTLKVESTPGEGATFTIVIPIV